MGEYKANSWPTGHSWRCPLGFEKRGRGTGLRHHLQAQGIHFWLFVYVILAGVAEAILKMTRLFGQRPDQAFAGRERFRLAAKDGIFERERSVNPLPARRLEGSHDFRKHESVQRVEMDEQSVTNIAAEEVQGKLAVKRGAIQEMRNQVVAIGSDRRPRIFSETIHKPLADIPVRSVNSDVAHAIAALLEQGAKAIALFRGVAFFQERIAEERGAVVEGSDYFLVFQKINGEVGIAGLLAIKFMRVGMIADEVARLVPSGDELSAVGFIYAHSANEQRGADILG